MEENENIDYGHFDLDGIAQEFLKYAPAYAQKEAGQALAKLVELQGQGLIRSGIYYIVLVDLVGSTKFAAEHGNDAINKRIRLLVTSSLNSISQANIKNTGIFLKEIGDAVLFIFHHFVDIIKWRAILQEHLDQYSSTAPESYSIRTCVHVGEVALNGVYPLSLAVSHTFKMEKSVSGGDIVLTDNAYSIAWSTLRRAYHAFSVIGEVKLDGYKEPVKLHKLNQMDSKDLSRIVKEQENTK